MSRNASTGAYLAPSNSFNPAVDGTTIDSSDQNDFISDLQTALSYQYGSATPTITFGGASTGITYTTQTYEYTVIGNRVFFSLQIVLSSKGSATGTCLVVVTHPHAPAVHEAVAMASAELINLDVAGGYYSLYATTTSAGFAIREQGDNVSSAAITDADFQNTSGFKICGHFRF